MIVDLITLDELEIRLCLMIPCEHWACLIISNLAFSRPIFTNITGDHNPVSRLLITDISVQLPVFVIY